MKSVKKALYAAVLMMFVFAVMSPVKAKAKVNTKISNSAVLKQQLKYSITVDVGGTHQTFAAKKNEVVKFEVKKKTLSKNKKAMTVNTKIVIDRSVANVKLEGTATYKLKKNKWKLASFVYDNTKTEITSINLKGNWEGTYRNSNGLMMCSVSIPNVTADGFISADSLLSFWPSPTASSGAKSGSYYITGGYDLKTGMVSLKGNEWKDRPEGWSYRDFTGHIDLLNKKITGNYEMSIEKTK